MAGERGDDQRPAASDPPPAPPPRAGAGFTLAAVAVLGVLALAVACIGERRYGTVRSAIHGLLYLPEPATLASGLGAGLAAALILAAGRGGLAARAAAAAPALAAALAYAAVRASLLGPAAARADLAPGPRARALADVLADATSPWALVLWLLALALAVAAVAQSIGAPPPGPGDASLGEARPPPSRARPWLALAASALALPAAALLGLFWFRGQLGERSTSAWLAAIPAALGAVALLRAGRVARLQRGERGADTAARAFAAAALAIGAVALAAIASGISALVISSFVSVEDLSLAVDEVALDARALAGAGALLTLPVLLAALLSLPLRALAEGLRRGGRAAALALAVALAPGLILGAGARAALTRIDTLARDAQRLAAEPGLPIADAALPAGALIVSLASAEPSIPILRPATIHLRPAGAAQRWAPGSPARFDGLGEGRHELHVEGPFLWAPVSLSLPDRAAGARVTVELLPIRPPGPRPVPTGMAPEKELEVDATSPEAFVLRWRQGEIALTRERVARAASEREGQPLRYPALTNAVARAWEAHGEHRDRRDRLHDHAWIVARPGSSLAEAKAVLAAVRSVPRPIYTSSGEPGEASAFQVALTEPRPPRLPAVEPEAAARDAAAAVAAARRALPEVKALPPRMIRCALGLEPFARIAAASAPLVEACLVEALGERPDLAGELHVHTVIDVDGVVARAQATAKLPGLPPPLLACAERAFRKLAFPGPGDGICVVDHGVTLTPTARAGR